jgi:hypothetical protein
MEACYRQHVLLHQGACRIMLFMQPATLLAAINEQHGTTFALVDCYADGESGLGAYTVVDASGRRGVLKQAPDSVGIDRLHEIGAATARLRASGYPAPQYLVVGCLPMACYSIQEMLPSAPMRAVPGDLVPRLSG